MMSNPAIRVLILCTGNSARSQMAEGLLRHLAPGHVEVQSAGTAPTPVKPEAIQVMKEIGIDISGQWSKHVDDLAGQPFDYVITVCDQANESCPIFPGTTRRIHWSFPDPAAVKDRDLRLTTFRIVRDSLRSQLSRFADSLVHR
jgi:arsenate reductase